MKSRKKMCVSRYVMAQNTKKQFQ